MKTVIFGGAFDPPHNGHLMIAHAVLNGAYADKVIFVPSFTPPHKPAKPLASFDHRLQMLRLASTADLRFSVSDIERRMRSQPTYSFEMLEKFSKENPSDKLILLIGSDSLCDLHSWHRVDELLQKWRLLTYPRPGFKASFSLLKKFWPAKIARDLMATLLPKVALSDIASSKIRDNIRDGKNIENLLAPKVLRYIVEQNLYKHNGEFNAEKTKCGVTKLGQSLRENRG